MHKICMHIFLRTTLVKKMRTVSPNIKYSYQNSVCRYFCIGGGKSVKMMQEIFKLEKHVVSKNVCISAELHSGVLMAAVFSSIFAIENVSS